MFVEGLAARGNITWLKEELREIIEPDNILLRSLQLRCALADEQIDKISNCLTVQEKADELLRWLVEDFTGDYDNLTAAFEEAGQKHIANFIIAVGGISSLFVFFVRVKFSVCLI